MKEEQAQREKVTSPQGWEGDKQALGLRLHRNEGCGTLHQAVSVSGSSGDKTRGVLLQRG